MGITHHTTTQESILPGQRKKGVDNILCGVAPCSVSPVNPRYCDLSQDEGPDNLSQRPLTNTRNGISTLDTNSELLKKKKRVRFTVLALFHCAITSVWFGGELVRSMCQTFLLQRIVTACNMVVGRITME